jgi:hypothetical protein
MEAAVTSSSPGADALGQSDVPNGEADALRTLLVTGPYHGLSILDCASSGHIGGLPVDGGKWVAVELPAN